MSPGRLFMVDIRLAPWLTLDSDTKFWWWACRVDLTGLAKPIFRIAKADHYVLTDGFRLACWATALDTDVWNDFDYVVSGDSDILFFSNTPINGTFYISHYPPFPMVRLSRLMDIYSASPYVFETPSSTDLIIGNTTERVSPVDGRTVPSLPFYGFKITNSASLNDKNKAVLTCGNHVGESLADWTHHAAIAFLLSADPKAASLRDWFEFYVYPCVNPGGKWNGLSIQSPENVALNHNRQWNTTGSLESIDLLKTTIAADTGSAAEVAIEYHGFADIAYSAGPPSGLAVKASGEHVLLETALQVYDADLDIVDRANPAGSMRDWFSTTLDGGTLEVCMTSETSHSASYTIADCETFGEQLVQALYDLLAAGVFPHGPI